jgi:hypothetical protein
MPYMNNVDAPNFFRHLSGPSFNQNFDVNDKGDSVTIEEEQGVLDFVIKLARPSKYPLDTNPEKILKVATNLVKLIKSNKGAIEGGRIVGCDADQMAKNLARKAASYAGQFDDVRNGEIQAKFGEAIALLVAAKDTAAVNFYRKNHYNPQVLAEKGTNYTEVTADDFYKAFSKTRWWNGFSGRIHVIETNRGPKFYRAPALGFTGKLSGQVENPARKLASMQVLADVMHGQIEFLIKGCANGDYNEDGMIKNFKSLKGRITRNMNPIQAQAINSEIDGMIKLLADSRKRIQEIRDNTFKAMLWRAANKYFLGPFHRNVTKPMLDGAGNIAGAAWDYSGGIVVNRVRDITGGVKKFLA